MPEALSYHVFDGIGLWLDDSEHNWTKHFHDAASFTSWEVADEIGKRECKDSAFYVFACMPSR